MNNLKKKSMKKPWEKHIFVRLGSVNGQYQTHRGSREAPVKRGIWAIPIQFSRELSFLGGGLERLDFNNRDNEKRNHLEDLQNQISYNKIIKLKDFKNLDIKHYRSKNFEYTSPYDINIVFSNKILNKKIKLHYKRIYLKMTDEIWCHLSPQKGIGAEWWYKCSVREFWNRSKKYLIENWVPEFYEIFIEM